MAAQPRPAAARVRFRPMKRRHLNQVLAIESTANPPGWSRAIFLSELLFAQDRFYLVAKVGRQVVGYVGVMFTPDEAHITTIAVHEDWRRRGIATRLMLRAFEAAQERGRDAMTLESRVSNHGAQALYERFGFQSAGIRPRYYADNREDALVMWVYEIRGREFRDRLAVIGAAFERPQGAS